MLMTRKTRANAATVAGFAAIVAVLLFANRRVFLPASPASLGAALPLPASFPAKFPLYPGATYLGPEFSVGKVEGRWFDHAWFKTASEAAKVSAWYDAHLAQSGFVPVLVMDKPNSRRYTFGADKNIIELEIFAEAKKPTSFSVDFFSESP